MKLSTGVKWQSIFPVCIALSSATLLCFWCLFLEPTGLLVGNYNGGQNDLTDMFMPREYVIQQIKSKFNQGPFWNPWLGGGTVLIGNPQTAYLYPFHWLARIFALEATVSWLLVAHHVIAGIGSYCLAQRLGQERYGSIFAAVTYGFAPILLSRTFAGHLLVVEVVAWYPWLFWAYLGLFRRIKYSGMFLTLFLTLMILAGHQQETFYACLVCACLFLNDLGAFFRRRQIVDAFAFTSRACLSLTCGLLLSAAYLVPVAIYLLNASTSARLRGVKIGVPGQSNLLQLIHPFALGSPSTYSGPGSIYWETLCYFGLMTLCLSILGTISTLRRKFDCRWVVVVALTSFTVAFANRIPGLGYLISLVPGLSELRCPGRWFLITSLMVSILAGFGIETLSGSASNKYGTLSNEIKMMMYIVIATLTLLTLSGYLGTASLMKNNSPVVDPRGLISWAGLSYYPTPWLLFILFWVCVAVCCSIPRVTNYCKGIMIILAIIESCDFSQTLFHVRNQESLIRSNPAVDLLSEKAKGWRIFATQSIISDFEAMQAGVMKVHSYDPVPIDRSLQYFAMVLNPRVPIDQMMGYAPAKMLDLATPLLDLWSVKYLLLTNKDSALSETYGWLRIADLSIPSLSDSIRNKAEQEICTVWENPNALPRGFVVGDVKLINSQASKLEIADAMLSLDPRKEVLLYQDDLSSGSRQAYTPAKILEDTPNRIVIEVETQAPGYLVLSDTWYPGWTAEDNGKSVTVQVANHSFRAIPLAETGFHHIVFSYYPVGLNIGLLITFVTATFYFVSYVWFAMRSSSGKDQKKSSRVDLSRSSML